MMSLYMYSNNGNTMDFPLFNKSFCVKIVHFDGSKHVPISCNIWLLNYMVKKYIKNII